MVIDASDYELPSPGKRYNPTNIRSFAGSVAGGVTALTVVLWMLRFAQSRGVPLMDQLAGGVSGGALSTEGSIEVFD